MLYVPLPVCRDLALVGWVCRKTASMHGTYNLLSSSLTQIPMCACDFSTDALSSICSVSTSLAHVLFSKWWKGCGRISKQNHLARWPVCLEFPQQTGKFAKLSHLFVRLYSVLFIYVWNTETSVVNQPGRFQGPSLDQINSRWINY